MPMDDCETISSSTSEELVQAESLVRSKRGPNGDKQRSATISMKRMSKKAFEAAIAEADFNLHDMDVRRPTERADCLNNGPNAQRPCPFVGCKWHLYLDESERGGENIGSIKINFPHLSVEELDETCALDVAEDGGLTLEEVGEVMNLTRERVRQIELRSMKKLKDFADANPGLKDFVEREIIRKIQPETNSLLSPSEINTAREKLLSPSGRAHLVLMVMRTNNIPIPVLRERLRRSAAKHTFVADEYDFEKPYAIAALWILRHYGKRYRVAAEHSGVNPDHFRLALVGCAPEAAQVALLKHYRELTGKDPQRLLGPRAAAAEPAEAAEPAAAPRKVPPPLVPRSSVPVVPKPAPIENKPEIAPPKNVVPATSTKPVVVASHSVLTDSPSIRSGKRPSPRHLKRIGASLGVEKRDVPVKVKLDPGWRSWLQRMAREHDKPAVAETIASSETIPSSVAEWAYQTARSYGKTEIANHVTEAKRAAQR